MVGECLDQNRPFGVIRAKEGGIAEIGCTAEIVTVTKRYDDGRMDIVTQGRERFEVVQVNQERAFLQAEVIYLQDEGSDAAIEQVNRAIGLHGEIMTLAGATPEDPAEVDKHELSFRLAGSLPIDLDFKQSLLAMKSESARLQAIILLFETILPNMRRTVQVRRRAGGNGHAS